MRDSKFGFLGACVSWLHHPWEEEFRLQGIIKSSASSLAGRGILAATRPCTAKQIWRTCARPEQQPENEVQWSAFFFFFLRWGKGDPEPMGNPPTVGSGWLHRSVICVVNIKCSGSWGGGASLLGNLTSNGSPEPPPHPHYLGPSFLSWSSD